MSKEVNLTSMFLSACLLIILVTSTINASSIQINRSGAEKSFYIDFANNTFVKDGKPFRYVSGSIHPYRVPNELWEDRLRKMWSSGLNTIQVYVFWNEHEPMPGVYDFDGQNDIFRFMSIAKSIGFVIVLRPGPYICGEHEFGGFPWWLLQNGTDIVLRSSDEKYMGPVRRWFRVLMPRLIPYLYKNGGPIITVQIENEYGSYYTCDKDYLTQLRDLMRETLGDDVVYFTTDGDSVDFLKCGAMLKDGVYATIDFGTDSNAQQAFKSQRAYEPMGPLVNSEFYPGWLDFWGSPHQKVDTSKVLASFYDMMNLNASVNFYMFHGGTNWGFSNGADPPYLVQPTSYDYDAPISESGDITDKYMKVREAISKYLPLPPDPVPANSTKRAYGKVQMSYYGSLVDVIASGTDKCVQSFEPLPFEKIGQGYGFVLYSTKLLNLDVYNKVLSVPGIRDRGYVQIGSKSAGVIYRNGIKKLELKIKENTNDTLYIIVENMGRLNFGNHLLDTIGIISNVTLDGITLTNWTMCLTNSFIPNYQESVSSSLNKRTGFTKFAESVKTFARNNQQQMKKEIDSSTPAVYIGQFVADSNSPDTFLNNIKFTKGVALILSENKFTNLGRYWPKTGPQVTLYTPGVFMTPNLPNTIILFEFENSPCKNSSDCTIDLIDYPIIDSIPQK